VTLNKRRRKSLRANKRDDASSLRPPPRRQTVPSRDDQCKGAAAVAVACFAGSSPSRERLRGRIQRVDRHMKSSRIQSTQ
jgi:hypothetical protein